MDRNHLAGTDGDAVNALLAAIGYNFSRLLAWLAFLSSTIRLAITPTATSNPTQESVLIKIFTDD